VVVVVEDAHWADEATLDLLVFLGRRMERTPALLLVTYRDDEVGAEHPLRGVLGALPQGVVHHLRLQPLSAAAVGELARRAGRPAAGLRALTGGNPLLVTEVLAAGDSGVPMTVRDLVLARLAGLPVDAQEVVRLVAVVPTGPSCGWWRRRRGRRRRRSRPVWPAGCWWRTMRWSGSATSCSARRWRARCRRWAAAS
jgi:hypothetical protein